MVLKFTDHYLQKLNEFCKMEQLPINVCFENDSLYYFLLILYAAIFNSLLTVPKPFGVKRETSGVALSLLSVL